MKPIRVLQVIGIMNRGGAETMIMNLYRHIDKTKVQFDFVEHTSEKAAFDDEILSMGGRIFHCPKYTGKNHLQYKKWWKDFFENYAEEYDVVHGHIGSTASIYLKMAKKYNMFTIAHSHNTKGPWCIKEGVYRGLSFGTRYIADYFFGCSIQAGIDRFGKRVASNKQKYQILNNAIDVDFYQYNLDSRTAVRKELGFTNEIVIGHVGRFETQKNHQFMLMIFKEILDINKNSKLVLIGDGVLKTEIQEKANELNINDNIIFTGTRSDINRLLQGIDVFLMPSLYEGLPVSIVEAQASGVPCVISDKIPKDCIITPIVSVMCLEDSAENWAKHVLSRAKEVRKDYSEEVKNSGFDITQTAKWLEEFYLEHSR